ncbi:MAG: hypothetical protein JO305_10255 [Alphaproteobacteria bacterium]|nr:hypothetical protein [Alphaproteobacteria bacterium]
MRPITLLLGCGIIINAAILIITGLAAGHMREQALATTEAELGRLDLVVAEEDSRYFSALDAQLQSIAERIRSRTGPDANNRAVLGGEALHELLSNKIGGNDQIEAVTLIGPDGKLVNWSRGWPVPDIDFSHRDYFRALSSDPGLQVYIGAAATDAGRPALTLARRLTGASGKLLGVLAMTLPEAEIENFYRSVPLGDDGTISLVRRDGLLLAHYPADVPIGQVVSDEMLGDFLDNGTGGTMREPVPTDGPWRIKAIHALRDYPLAVMLSRRGDRALAGWSRQVLLFAGLAVIGAFAVAAMVLLIARQIRIYSTLATIRAEKIEVERARIAAEAELLKKERLSVLGQLTATVAHELRNPLSAIRNTLFSIKELASSKGLKLDRPVARMERSIERCDRIIADLLEYTKTRELRRSTVAFDRWLDDVLNDQSLPSGIVLTRDLHAGNAAVPIDADRIRRVVINLLDNSAQALTEDKAGTGEKRITVSTAPIGDTIRMVIEDSGPGIPAENLARIFEPLFSTKSFGTGLGLATVKQIVMQHEGDIAIDSEPGKGTRVTVRLPLGELAKAAA